MIRKQGESIFRDYALNGNSVSGYTGKWQLRDINDTIILFGDATVSVDNTKIQFRLTYDTLANVLGDYVLTFEVSNISTGFQQEFQENVTFLGQDIDNVFTFWSLDFSLAKNSLYIPILG